MSLDSDRRRCYTAGMKINAVLEPQPEGGFTAYIPVLPGCVSEGETEAAAKKNLHDALQGYLTVTNKRFSISGRPTSGAWCWFRARRPPGAGRSRRRP